jgi:multidrug resistance efflux pump
MEKKLMNLSATIVIALSACHFKNPDKDSFDLSVKIEKIENTTFPTAIISSDIVSSGKGPKLSFKTGGRVSCMYVEEGQLVRQGQLLATLNMTEVDANINEVQTAYVAAKWNFIHATNLLKARTITLEHWEYAESALRMANDSLQIASLHKQFSAIYAPEAGTILRKLTEEGEIVAPGSPVYVIN